MVPDRPESTVLLDPAVPAVSPDLVVVPDAEGLYEGVVVLLPERLEPVVALDEGEEVPALLEVCPHRVPPTRRLETESKET